MAAVIGGSQQESGYGRSVIVSVSAMVSLRDFPSRALAAVVRHDAAPVGFVEERQREDGEVAMRQIVAPPDAEQGDHPARARHVGTGEQV